MYQFLGMSFGLPPWTPTSSSTLKDALERAGSDGVLVQQNIETELHKGMRMGKNASVKVGQYDGGQNFVATAEHVGRIVGIIEKEYHPNPLWKKCREVYHLFEGDEIYEVLLVKGHGPHDWDDRKRKSVRQLIIRTSIVGCSSALREAGWSGISRYHMA
jgi:hypothetical protein